MWAVPLFFIYSGVSHGDTCWKNVHINEELVRSTKKCFLEVAKALSLRVYFFFWTVLCLIQHWKQGWQPGSSLPRDSWFPCQDGAGTTRASWLLCCGVGPWVCGRLSGTKERSAPFSCAGIRKVSPRLMQPKFELQVSLESNALPHCLAWLLKNRRINCEIRENQCPCYWDNQYRRGTKRHFNLEPRRTFSQCHVCTLFQRTASRNKYFFLL